MAELLFCQDTADHSEHRWRSQVSGEWFTCRGMSATLRPLVAETRDAPRTPGYDGPEGTEWPGGKAIPCTETTPHHGHPLASGGQCHGVRPTECRGCTNCPPRSAAAIPDAGHMANEDSPLPCRCYFTSGVRVTADCQQGHHLRPPALTDDEMQALLDRWRALDPDQKIFTGGWMIGYLSSQSLRDGYVARELSDLITRAENYL